MEKRSVYFVDLFNKDEQGFIPCIAVEGEKGYYKTDWHWDCSLEQAEEICKQKNANLGFTDQKEIAKIIISTMGYKGDKMNISNHDGIIDSRDIIAELKDLEQELEDWIEDGGSEEDFDALEDLEELREWNELGAGIDDWDYGATLIKDEYFEEYAEQLVKDIGDLPGDLPYYIENNIDWDGVAYDIKADYTEIDLSGETYWVR